MTEKRSDKTTAEIRGEGWSKNKYKDKDNEL